MQEIYAEIVKALDKKEGVALATLITRLGSAPRGVGAKYLVKAGGESFGSIGGGCVEADVWQEAQGVIEKLQGKVMNFRLTADQLAEGGLICGGDIDIFLEPLVDDFLAIYREILKIKQKGGAAVLATVISRGGAFATVRGSKMLVRASGERVGSLHGAAEVEEGVVRQAALMLEEKRANLVLFCPETVSSSREKVEILLEPIISEPTVYIFGAGHISQQVAPLAKRVSFKVVVIDDREMFANRERFPEADHVIVSPFENSFAGLAIDDASYLVIVTRGHLYDGCVLEEAVRTKARYIGMIGSKKKVRTLFQNLLEKGVSKEVLDRVHAPIGIDINSETPEEIGISIVAELIKIRGQS
jgi:xanthine dehydrogenase accessory factor